MNRHFACFVCSIAFLCSNGPTVCLADDAETAKLVALCEQLKSGDNEIRNRAYSELAKLGPNAEPAIPTLIQLLEYDKGGRVSTCAAHMLERIGTRRETVLPALIIAAEKYPGPKFAVQFAQQRYTEATPDSVVLSLIHHADPNVRAVCIQSLRGRAPLTDVETLIPLLDDESAVVRANAALLIARAGKAGRPAFASLVKHFDDRTKVPFEAGVAHTPIFATVREHAALAAAAIGPDVLPQLLEIAKDKKPVMRESAAFALGKIESKSRDIFEALQTLLADPEPDVRVLAAISLGWRGSESTDAVSKLVSMLNSEADAASREFVVQSLVQIGEPVDVIVPAIASLARDGVTRTMSVRALARFGARAAASVPDLKAVLADGDISVRYEVAKSLWAIAGLADGVMPTYLDVLRTPPKVEVTESIRIENMKEVKTTRMRARRTGYHLDVLRRLQELGPRAKDAVPVLIERLTGTVEEPAHYRGQVMATLGAIGPAAIDAVPVLEKIAANGPSSGSKEQAREALKKIRGEVPKGTE